MSKWFGIAFLLLPMAFWTGTKDPFFVKETVAQVFFLGAGAWWLTAWLEKRRTARKPALAWPIALFLAGSLFSLKNAAHPQLVWQQLEWQALLVLVYFLAAQMDETEIHTVWNAIGIASLACALYGAAQRFGYDWVGWSTDWGGRPGSSFGNPNFAAGWWAMVSCIAFAQAWTQERRRGLWLALGFLVLLNLYWGKTRGAWIATSGGLTFMAFLLVWTKFPARRKALLATACIGIVGGAILTAALAREKIRSGDLSVLERAFKWACAAEMIRDHPWLGAGAGNLKTNFALVQAKARLHPFFRDRLIFRATSESSVHNDYLQIWAETGLIGLGAFLWILMEALMLCFRGLPGQKPFERIGAGGALCAFALYELTNFPLRIAPNACLFFFLLGSLESQPAAKSWTKNTPARPQENLQARPGIRIATALATVILLWRWSWPAFCAERSRLLGDLKAYSGDFEGAAALYEKAIRLDYWRSEKTAYELGECQRKMGRFDRAIEAYQISVSLRNYGEVYNNIGNCYYLLKRPGEAAANWQIAVRLGLPDPQAQAHTEKNLEQIRKQLEERPL